MKKLLFGVVLLLSFVLNGNLYADLNDGLLAYYSFNGHAYDETGNGNDGIPVGVIAAEDKCGSSDSSYFFSGTDYINLDFLENLANGYEEAWSVSLWFKANNLVNENIFATFRQSDGGREVIRLWISGNQISIAIRDENGVFHMASYPFTDTVSWHNAIMTYDGEKATLYLDTIQIAETNSSSIYDAVSGGSVGHYVGDDFTGSGDPGFEGWIDEMRIYNRVLSEEDIQELYSEKCGVNTGLVAYYPFNGNANDESGNGNHGSVYGATYTTSGKEGGAYDFDGVDDRIGLPALDFSTGKASVSFWINSDTGSGGNEEWAFFYRDPEMLLRISINSPGCDLAAQIGGVGFSLENLNLSGWKHIVIAGDVSGNCMLYIDGNLVLGPVTSTSIPPGTIYRYIGTDAPIHRNFDGIIDEVRIYNRVISEIEIQELSFKNLEPVLDPIGNQTGFEGQLLEFTVTASDPDIEDILTFSVDNLPDGAIFDTETATFSWVPDFSQEGNYENIIFSVADDGDPLMTDVEAMNITIGNVNRPPVFDPIGLQAVNEGETVNFVVTANDPDGDQVDLDIDNLPYGATFDLDTGTFSWTPDYLQEGSYAVTFRATDYGSPVEVSEMIVSITVGNIPNPVEITTNLKTEVEQLDISGNSLVAPLANAIKFLTDQKKVKIKNAIIQLFNFMCKVEERLIDGSIDSATAENLIFIAESAVLDLGGDPSTRICD